MDDGEHVQRVIRDAIRGEGVKLPITGGELLAPYDHLATIILTALDAKGFEVVRKPVAA